jgi:DegV family protein with EDD domain
MSKIAIVTDTDASLPLELAGRYQIRQVAINIHFGEETMRAVEQVDDAGLFDRIDREGKYPTTSAPSPGQFAQAFQASFEQGAEYVVCLCVSSKVSATYGAALQGVEMLDSGQVTVVDTQTLSMAQGFMALAAAEAAAGGADVAEVVSVAKDVGQRSKLYASLATLKYLAMGGRVPHLQANIANLLNVKPVLTVRDGTLDLLERVRTQKKSWNRVVELTAEAVGEKAIERMAMVHIKAPEEAQKLQLLLAQRLQLPEEIFTSELTPGLSVHGGVGMVGVCVQLSA